MRIETERLSLILLSTEELKLWIDDVPALERKLNCTYKGEVMEGHLHDMLKCQYEKAINDPKNNLYHNFFFLMRKTDNVVVGSADFKYIPNENGEVEIGYGLGKEFEHNGYMTEAVKAMCKFGLKQDNVKSITAETYLDNSASQNVLKRCGFVKDREGETLWWKLY